MVSGYLIRALIKIKEERVEAFRESRCLVICFLVVLSFYMMLSGCASVRSSMEPGPGNSLPLGVLFRPTFDISGDRRSAGTAFVARVGTQLYLLTAHHLLGKAGGYERDLGNEEIADRFVSVSATEIRGGKISVQTKRYLPIVGASAISAEMTTSDVAGFPLEGTVETAPALKLAVEVPAVGDRVYLAAQILAQGFEGRVLHPGIVEVSGPNFLSYRFEDPDILLRATSGAPVLNEGMQVVGLHVGGRESEEGVVGGAIPSVMVRARVVLSEQRRHGISAWVPDRPELRWIESNLPAVRLLTAGAEPRRPLRYRLDPRRGTSGALVYQMWMTLGSSLKRPEAKVLPLPQVRFDFQIAVESSSPDRIVLTGAGHYSVEPSLLDPGEVITEMRRKTHEAGEIPFRFEINDRGLVPTRGWSIGRAAQGGELFGGAVAIGPQVTVPFPDEPIGVGAEWECSERVVDGTLLIAQSRRFRLLKLEGSKGRVEIVGYLRLPSKDARIDDPNPSAMQLSAHEYEYAVVGESAFDLRRSFAEHSELVLGENRYLTPAGEPAFFARSMGARVRATDAYPAPPSGPFEVISMKVSEVRPELAERLEACLRLAEPDSVRPVALVMRKVGRLIVDLQPPELSSSPLGRCLISAVHAWKDHAKLSPTRIRIDF